MKDLKLIQQLDEEEELIEEPLEEDIGVLEDIPEEEWGEPFEEEEEFEEEEFSEEEAA